MREKLGHDTIDFQFFNDFWQFYQNHNIPESDNQTYWNDLIQASRELAGKYKGTPIEQMAKDIIHARQKHLERVAYEDYRRTV